MRFPWTSGFDLCGQMFQENYNIASPPPPTMLQRIVRALSQVPSSSDPTGLD
jgi:hypothetical protein